MATKKQVTAALQAHAPGATLIDTSDGYAWSCELEAPRGHHWADGVHTYACPSYYVDDGGKGQFWAQVLEDILNHLEPAVPCVPGSDCEGVKLYGACEYWEE